MPELVSILIPAYNAEEWLPATIQSALVQTWPRTEVIVVDDGSKDGTLATARAFESKKVKVVTQPNSGAPAARNKAFELAQGTQIQWLDADDLLDPGKVSVHMQAAREIDNPRVMLAGSFGTFFYRAAKAVFAPTSLWCDLSPVDYLVTRFRDNVYFQTGAWLVSRELSEATGPWTEFGSPDDDGEYFCRMVTKSQGVKFVPDARIYYRVGNYGALNKARSATAQTALFGSKVKCINYLRSLDDSPRSRAAAVQLLHDTLSYFYPEREDLVNEARRLAAALGGELREPVLKWKYRPVEWLCGRSAAITASRTLPRIRGTAARQWDRYLYRLSSLMSSSRRQGDPIAAAGAQK
jgi:glycosyltransferase involved in cell wall biosynthesis